MSVSGGNEKSNFIGTLGYTNQTGISINSGMERFTGRIDANSKWNKFEYGMNATFHGLVINIRRRDSIMPVRFILQISIDPFHTYL